jgi:hypothetical protein
MEDPVSHAKEIDMVVAFRLSTLLVHKVAANT